MPRRQGIRRMDSEDVMGEGSYVVVRPVTYGEAQKIMRVEEGSGQEQAALEQLVVDTVVEWNWVDDDGGPLPQPNDPEVLQLLYTHEFAWLVDAILASTERRKN